MKGNLSNKALQFIRISTFRQQNGPLRDFRRNVANCVIAAKRPFEVPLVEGKRYSWCKCGYSDKQPFCDGQHRKKAHGVSPVRFVADKTGLAYLCGCKQTKTAPYCDGTHKSDAVQGATLGQ